MRWEGEYVINIVCKPFEIKLSQLVPFLLATPNPYVFNWSKGYMFFIRYDSEIYFDIDKKTAGHVTVIYQLQYLKTACFKFIKLDGNTGKIKFVNEMESESNYFYYPISDELDEVIMEVLKKVKEWENAIKRK